MSVFEDVIRAIYHAGSGHPGGSVTAIVPLYWLFFDHMKPQPYDFSDPDRDIFILSKGHAAPAFYAVLERLGVITEAELMSLRKLGAKAQGHPSLDHLPEAVTSTGSLGQGLAVAAGMALAKRNRRVFCLVGDGDMQEGISSEVARFAVERKLNNLVVIWDKNDALSDEYSVVYPDIHLEWSAVGWDVFVGTEYQAGVMPVLLVNETIKALPHGSVKLSEDDLCKMLRWETA